MENTGEELEHCGGDEGVRLLGNNLLAQHQSARDRTKQNQGLKYGAEGNIGDEIITMQSLDGNKRASKPTLAAPNMTTTQSQTLDMKNAPDDSHDGSGGEQKCADSASSNAVNVGSKRFINTTTTIAGGGGGVDDGPSEHDSVVQTHHDYKGPKIWQIFVQQWPFISQPLALAVIAICLWILAYALLPDYAMPSSAIMRIFFLFVGAQLSGVLVTLVCLPDMLGMLFFGVLYTNAGLADFAGYEKFEAFLREMALINIMLLAGLGLDENTFKKLWLMIARLTLVPTIAEVTIIALLARYTLDMPWLWGILLGLVVTAVSPNVVVTVMLKLKEEHLGLNSGIHTLIYAMTSCNDVVAIFLFGVVMCVIFATDKSLTEQILQGPIGIGIGIVFGYVYGLVLTVLPSQQTSYLNGLRFVLTILGGTISVIGSRTIGYPSAGALGCMTIAFFASIGWKRQQRRRQVTARQLENENSTVPARLDLLWKFLKPVSFSLIGKEINFTVLDGRVVGYGALLVLLGSLFRLVFAYLSTYGGNLTRKERAYITISGFPKATVQAALGPLALDMARRSPDQVDEQIITLANNVLIISVLAIVFTAPLGAVLMLKLAPFWLQRSKSDAENSDCPNISLNGDYDFKTSSSTSTKGLNCSDVAIHLSKCSSQSQMHVVNSQKPNIKPITADAYFNEAIVNRNIDDGDAHFFHLPSGTMLQELNNSRFESRNENVDAQMR